MSKNIIKLFLKILASHLSSAKNFNIGALITLGPNSSLDINDSIVITVYKQKNLSCLPPKSTIFFFSENDLEFMK